MRLIGIAGKARHGKDSVAKVIKGYTGLETYALADPIKQCISEIFRLDERHTHGHLKETKRWFFVPKMRHIVDTIEKYLGEYEDPLIEFDSGIFERHGPDAAYDMFVSSVLNNNTWFVYTSPRELFQKFGTDFGRKEYNDNIWLDLAPDECIISDIRFENEAQYVRDNGGIIIHVDRENMPETVVEEHSSEGGVEFKECDYKITNIDSDIWQEHLVKESSKIMKQINGE